MLWCISPLTYSSQWWFILWCECVRRIGHHKLTPEVGCESSSLYIACEILIKLRTIYKKGNLCSKTSLQQPDHFVIVSPSGASVARIDCCCEAWMFPQPQMWKWDSFNFIGLSKKSEVLRFLGINPFAVWGIISYFSLNSYIFFMRFVQIMTYLFILIIEDSVFISLRENLLTWCESSCCTRPQSGLRFVLLLLLLWHGWCVERTQVTCLLLLWTDKCEN